MDRTAETGRGRHWELRARVASGVFFAAALVGFSLPWEPVESSDEILAKVFFMAAPVVGLTLSFRGTRRAAVVRAILAFVGVMLFGLPLLIAFGWTGRPPDFAAGWWLTFWALVGAFVVNVIAARAGTVRSRKSGMSAPTRLRVRRSDV
ncbi:MAG: hypothetical protein ACRDGW_11975 [Actinomycetota bacterium]